MKTFGELIKQHRKDHKLTQEQFGKTINKKQETISNYEKGVHYPIDAEELDAIAKSLKLDVSDIVNAIKYSKNGAVGEGQHSLIELTKNNLRERYVITVDGAEVTDEEFDRMIRAVRFERFISS